MRTLICLALGVGLLPSVCAQDHSRDLLILTNVNVVDTRFGAIAGNQTVVIKNGRIAGIARHALIPGNRSTQVVNASGKYLIPGLWDMHVHSARETTGGWDERAIYPLYVANGVTGIRDMSADFDALKKRRDRIAAGELLGPHILMAGPFLSAGKSGAQTIGANTPQEGRMAVRELKRQGVDFVRILPALSRESYFAIADESQKQHLPLTGYPPESVTALEASARGQRIIEDLSGVALACSAKEDALRHRRLEDLKKNDLADYEAASAEAMASYDQQKAWSVFVQLADNFTWQVPTLSWWHAEAELTKAKARSDPRLKYVPASVQSAPDSEILGEHRAEPVDLEKTSATFIRLAGVMRHNAVPFLAGTDSPAAYVFPGFSLHEELELMVQGGFTNLEALQAATFNPALFQTKLDQYGLVEQGRVADLVLLDANPLADIRNTRKIAAVIMGGKFYNRSALDRMLNAVAALVEVQGTPQQIEEKSAPVATPSR